MVEFIRFDNVDDDPRVSQIRIAGLAYDETALTVPHPDYPSVSVNQEPAIVKLPDGRLFAVTRTMDGSPYWTMSNDSGDIWSPSQPLLEHEGGARLLHPLSPCPIYDLDGDAAGSGEYVLFIHNNDGHLPGVSPMQTGFNRRPIFLVRGHFDPDGKQPVRFEKPTRFMDHDGTPLGAPGTKGRVDLAMYSSLTCRDGQPNFWYRSQVLLLGRQLEK